MRLFISIILIVVTQFLNAQDQNTATVLMSSLSTQDQLSRLVEDVASEGIIIDIETINWNDDKDRITLINFSTQYTKDDGTLSIKNNFNFKYNVLNEGSILMIKSSGGAIIMNNRQLLEDVREVIQGDSGIPNTVYTSFSEPFDAHSNEALNTIMTELRWKFRTSNELVYQMRKERDPGSERYMYRYYYNGQRLAGSFGLSEVDMYSDAYVQEDEDAVLSLFINSDKDLSPFAVLEN